jgi:DNA-binding MarR family transcriptional regulator
MTTVGQPVNGQDINLAASATRTVLEVLLAEQGTSFAPFAAMNQMVALGPSANRDELVRRLGAAFQVDDATVLALLHGLQARGLVRQTTPSAADTTVHVQLTAEGEAEHQRLSSLVAAVTAELYRGFDAEDLATTRRVLVTLTERASAQVRSGIS